MLQRMAATWLAVGIVGMVGAGQATDDAEMIRSLERRIAKAWVDRIARH